MAIELFADVSSVHDNEVTMKRTWWMLAVGILVAVLSSLMPAGAEMVDTDSVQTVSNKIFVRIGVPGSGRLIYSSGTELRLQPFTETASQSTVPAGVFPPAPSLSPIADGRLMPPTTIRVLG